MSIRRLVRLSQLQVDGLQTTNWTTEATETYVPATPAVTPSSWGTTAEIANLDRDFDATGSTKLHLGALLTITDAPDRLWGAQVKAQVTYGASDAPKLELWTFDATNGWVLRRRLAVSALARSGDPTVFDLVLATPLTGVSKVWITLNPTSTETNTWVELHLYGDCDTLLDPGDCAQFSEPPDCTLGWPAGEPPPGGIDFPPWDPQDPLLEPIPGIPPGSSPPTDFELPPVTLAVPMPTTYVHQNGQWGHTCPAPAIIRFYYSIRAGSSARISVLSAPGIVFDNTSVIVSGSSFVDFTVTSGFSPDGIAPRGPFLPPRQILSEVTFALTPRINFSILDFFDWESFLITYDIVYFGSEVC